MGVTGSRGDDKGPNLEEGKGIGVDSIISDYVYVCTKKNEVLIEVPSKRIKVIDHKHVQRTSEMFGKRHDQRRVRWQSSGPIFPPVTD
jgi:hypothetical protein